LWTVETAADDGEWIAPEQATANGAAAARVRRQAYDAVLAELSIDDGLGVVGQWAAPLAERRRLALVELSRTAPPSTDVDETPIPVVDGATTDERPHFDQVWEAAEPAGARHLYAVFDGGASSFVLRPVMNVAAAAARQFIAPCLCLLAGLCGFLWGRNDGTYRWAPVICAAAGVVWITFLQPAPIGWALVVAAVASRLHPSLRRARERRAAAPVALRLAR
jgi:hypothetical protein